MAYHNQDGGRDAARREDSEPTWRPEDIDEPPQFRARDDDEGWRSAGRDDERHGDRYLGGWGRGRGREFGARMGPPAYPGPMTGPMTAPEDREEAGRYGQGPGAYGAGRYGEDRLHDLHQLHQRRGEPIASAGSFEDRYRDVGGPDRFAGRGRPASWLDRPAEEHERYGGVGGYAGRDFEHERYELAHGRRGFDERMAHPMSAHEHDDERMGYPAGSYSRGDARGGPAMSAYGRHPGDAGGYAGSLAGTQDTARREHGADVHTHRGTGPHRGKGPLGYQRSDERLREMVCESLTDDDQVDASNIEVTVSHGEVTLSGSVDARRAKRDAEDCACSVPGVRDVQNLLRVREDVPAARAEPSSPRTPGRSESERPTPDARHRA